MRDDEREEGEAAEVRGEHVVERDAGDDAGEGDWQDDEVRDGLAAEESVAGNDEGDEDAEDERDRSGGTRDEDRCEECIADPLAVDGPAPPLGREAARRPGE